MRPTQGSIWVNQIMLGLGLHLTVQTSTDISALEMFVPHLMGRGNFITTIIAANYYGGGPSLNDINIARSRWGGLPLLIHLYLYPSLPKLDVTPSTSGTYNFDLNPFESINLIYKLWPHIRYNYQLIILRIVAHSPDIPN